MISFLIIIDRIHPLSSLSVPMVSVQDPSPLFEVAPATANDDNGNGHFRFNNTGKQFQSSCLTTGSTSPTCITVDTESLSSSSRSIVSSLTSSSITLNWDKETFIRNALRRAKLLQEYHSRIEEQKEDASPQSLKSPKHYKSQNGWEYERGILQTENARTNAKHAPRKPRSQFQHTKSDDIVNSILLNRSSLQRQTPITTTLHQKISQEQNRCRERLRLLKEGSTHQFLLDEAHSTNDNRRFNRYIYDDDDESSGYYSSCSASLSIGDEEEDQACPDMNTINVVSAGIEELPYLEPLSLYSDDGNSSSAADHEDYSSSAKAVEFQDVWTWFGDEDDSLKERKDKKVRIITKCMRTLCFRKKNRYAAMDDQMSLLSDM